MIRTEAEREECRRLLEKLKKIVKSREAFSGEKDDPKDNPKEKFNLSPLGYIIVESLCKMVDGSRSNILPDYPTVKEMEKFCNLIEQYIG